MRLPIPTVPSHTAVRCLLALAAFLAASAASAPPLRAQGGGGVLRGSVVDEASGAPVPEARVVVDDRAGAHADRLGRFRISGIGPGPHSIRVERLGYGTANLEMMLGDSIELTVSLQAEAQPLPAVTVTAPGPLPQLPLGMGDFRLRRTQNAGGGRFYTRVELNAIGRTTLVNVLRRMPGARIIHARTTMGDYLATGETNGPHTMISPRPCYAQVVVNGVPVFTPGRGGDPPNLNDFDLNDLEGIEYYSQASSTPSEFRNQDVTCGTLLLWMRAAPADRPR